MFKSEILFNYISRCKISLIINNFSLFKLCLNKIMLLELTIPFEVKSFKQFKWSLLDGQKALPFIKSAGARVNEVANLTACFKFYHNFAITKISGHWTKSINLRDTLYARFKCENFCSYIIKLKNCLCSHYLFLLLLKDKESIYTDIWLNYQKIKQVKNFGSHSIVKFQNSFIYLRKIELLFLNIKMFKSVYNYFLLKIKIIFLILEKKYKFY